MSALGEIEALLRARIGFDATTVGAKALAHAVRGRVRARAVDGTAAYLALLGDDRAEWEALLEAIVVPETWFFRDRHPFAFLGRWAARHCAGRGPADPVTVLSLPCATGEEAWSIAIALAAAGIEPRAFRVDALDLSERALHVARAARYGPRALRRQRVEADWAAYLHHAADGSFEVAPALRPSVHFARGNVVAAPALLRRRRYDCIFSRNLLIYCDGATRAAALAAFSAALRPDGLLFLGHAETLPAGTPGFVRESPPAAFVWRRGETPPRRRPAAPARAATPPRRPVHVRTRPAPAAADSVADARRLADRGQLAHAASMLERRVRRLPADAEAHALLGVVLATQGRDREAVAHLRRALYLDPAHEESLIHLALLLDRAGDSEAAARLRERARRAEGAR